MSLGNKQRKFTFMVAKLIWWAYDHGYEITLGDAYRDPRVHGSYGETTRFSKQSYSSSKSNHKLRLAIDLNLFKDGVYMTATEDYAPLGEHWISLGGEWGGSGDRQDGNHFSLNHDGRW